MRLLFYLLLLASSVRAEEVVFPENSPFSANVELSRRSLSPLTADALFAGLAKAHKRMAGQPLAPEQEHFILHVPPAVPSGGYGLLVFVGPWDEAKLPRGWGEVLDELGVIYVSAAHGGNEQITLARREPLALMAASGVQKLYPIDPAHIFIGGMSGGSRVAERLAVAYPDLFKGALLEAGSDPIGDRDLVIPPKELFRQFQEESRLVFVTGEQDTINLSLDRGTLSSLNSFCVFGTDSQTVPRLGHQIAPSASLEQALRSLLDPRPIDPGRLESCRAKLGEEVGSALAEVRTKSDLDRLDLHFGGLAAPESVERAHALEAADH